jgi:hypothetical protein
MTTLSHSYVDSLEIIGASTSLKPQGQSRLVYGVIFLQKGFDSGQRSEYIDYTNGWKVQGSDPEAGKVFICSPNHPQQLWGTPTLTLNGNLGKGGEGM